ncbi:MAG: AAA family ATPase [Pseudonocardiaceae bacterium]
MASKIPGAQSLGAGAQSMPGIATSADLARLLRQLRRRQARQRGETTLTYRELAAKTGWSVGIIGEYFAGNVLPPTDRFDVLIQLLGATPAEQGWLATARDRVEEYRHSQPLTNNSTTSGRYLPPAPTRLLGRDAEIKVLVDLLAGSESRLVTLIGPDGVGKTNLALAAATQLMPYFLDGVAVVSLLPVRDPGLVVPTIAEALGVRKLDARPLTEVVHEHLRTRQVLLVLDNAEHLLPGAPQLAALLAAAPGLRMLVTSRSPLGLQGEQLHLIMRQATEAAGELGEQQADEQGTGGGQRVVSTQVQGFAEVVGRQHELSALRAGFTDPKRPRRPVLRVLTGLGGVGKTALARAYAQRYQDQYELVWWVRAEDPEAVPGEFRALLDILAPQYAKHTHNPVQAMHTVLANRTGPWLLVIDNIAKPAALRGLLPAAGNGDVLITSRAGNWPDQRIVLPVQPLAKSHAVLLVTSLSGDPDQATAALLAEELGCLPLALAQASCYVAHSVVDLAGYLTLYSHCRAELHREGQAPDYPDTVATTWELALHQLSAPARALLNLLAWYASDTIPLDQLLTRDVDHVTLPEAVSTSLRPLLTDALYRQRALTELITYGLVTHAGPRGSVTVHRLVQAITADQLTARNDNRPWIDAAAALLDAACPRWPSSWEATASLRGMQTLQTHVRVLIQHLHPNQLITLNLRYTLADWTGVVGDFVRARELTGAVVKDMMRVLGPHHIHTLVTRIAFAYWTGEAGDVVYARELAAAAVDDLTRLFGPDHWYTLLAQGNLIRWTGAAGQAVRARELAAAGVKDSQRMFGPDHRLTLLARVYLVRWTGEAGDATDARELAAAVVADIQRVRGIDHRDTLAARAYLVRWTGETGDIARALELAAALVEDDERVLGPDHPHTLLARAYLAQWSGKAGNVARAG